MYIGNIVCGNYIAKDHLIGCVLGLKDEDIN